MIKDYRNAEDYGGYEYYDLAGEPVRVVLSKDGNKIGADMLNYETGELCRAITAMSKVDTDPHSDEITEEEFYVLCEKKMNEKKTMPPEPNSLG